MRFKCVCLICGEFIWVRGEYESDTNATTLNENDSAWDEACEHIKDGSDYSIIDSEPIDDEY
jgi:hypothetical protein